MKKWSGSPLPQKLSPHLISYLALTEFEKSLPARCNTSSSHNFPSFGTALAWLRRLVRALRWCRHVTQNAHALPLAHNMHQPHHLPPISTLFCSLAADIARRAPALLLVLIHMGLWVNRVAYHLSAFSESPTTRALPQQVRCGGSHPFSSPCSPARFIIARTLY